MYWIDINLLNDRDEFAPDLPTAPTRIQDDKTPMFLGLGIGIAAIAIAFGAFGVVGFLNQQLADKEQELNQDIARLGPQLQEVEQLQQELDQVQAETDALAKVFNQIKPWSAMLADLRDRVPSTLQISAITQSKPAPVQAAEGAPSAPAGATSSLSLKGTAISFGDVNDFVLTLRQSNYLSQSAANTRLKNATRQDQQNSGGLVEYDIDTQINDAPAESLLTALRQHGAAGLVARIETLKRQGVIKP
ncbi:PilN domain-containing protein [Lyngbya confervoides]|uniref:PilN domain-containing protein n=1 Tax=Lyngbya confervoides BDU141951 TaxID=1574623 RepID=A0ABD4SYY0_9CYAN|nr:PilN domain-containing protein [Lyngbya confervoides]MCM1981282.1 PilN domain-containing protein [Lyngbya confervoides BDU141951]